MEAAVDLDDPWANGRQPSWERIRANIDRIVARDAARRQRTVPEMTVRTDDSIRRAEPGEVDEAIVAVLGASSVNLRKGEIVERTGANEHTVADALARLRVNGVIVKDGVRAGSTYRLASQDGLGSDAEPEPELELEPELPGPEVGGPGLPDPEGYGEETAESDTESVDLVPTPPADPVPEVPAVPLPREDTLDTSVSYVHLIELLRDVYGHSYDRFLTLLLEQYSERPTPELADRIERILDGLVGWVE